MIIPHSKAARRPGSESWNKWMTFYCHFRSRGSYEKLQWNHGDDFPKSHHTSLNNASTCLWELLKVNPTQYHYGGCQVTPVKCAIIHNKSANLAFNHRWENVSDPYKSITVLLLFKSCQGAEDPVNNMRLPQLQSDLVTQDQDVPATATNCFKMYWNNQCFGWSPVLFNEHIQI